MGIIDKKTPNFPIVENSNPSNLPIASASSVGVVKPGTGLSVSGDGTLSATASTLKIYTKSIATTDFTLTNGTYVATINHALNTANVVSINCTNTSGDNIVFDSNYSINSVVVKVFDLEVVNLKIIYF